MNTKEYKGNHMGNHRIPISVRISQEDSDFISNLQIEGAHTPSEKIRELLKQARLAHETVHDYDAALTHSEQFLQGARHQWLLLEKSLGVHSPILARAFELVPDLVASLGDVLPDEADINTLKQHEKQVLWRIIRLMDGVLQLAITGKGAGYDDAVLGELANTLKLADIVNQLQTITPTKKGDSSYE